ncbi:magnesium chelatase accessory protein [Rubricella aquisinus]|uniref:Magnesium chelatase accessory protein n=1 Tax=Rubricella aquisinus TaxID=2028108 RepID=A0A840WS95_9RHOB|nr:alpha/beta fold hydrolase BchO [Rubricella aquisinus]MBB5516893.1 magnesium chelatase accessory protein [Rubricella aquisinus]
MTGATPGLTEWRRMTGGSTLDWDRDGADWPNRTASRFVEAAHLRWHVQRAGTGPAILLIHGTGASGHSWRDVFPLLAARADVISVDLPGHGFTARPASARLTLPAIAADLARLMEALEARPALIVGHSAGAAIALRMALDGAAEGAGLIGINGALTPFRGLAGMLFPQMARLLALNPLTPHLVARTASDPASVARIIGSTGSQIDPLGLDLYQRLVASPTHVAATLDMMARWQLEPLLAALPRIAHDVTLMRGLRDRAVPPDETARAARRLPAATLEDYPEGGHLLHEEMPQQISAAILDRLPASSPVQST